MNAKINFRQSLFSVNVISIFGKIAVPGRPIDIGSDFGAFNIFKLVKFLF